MTGLDHGQPGKVGSRTVSTKRLGVAMSGFWLVLGLAALPAAGNFVGGVLAELVRGSQRTLSLALHLAAGIVLAVVGLELMPEALEGRAPWVPLLAFVGGGAIFVGLDRMIGYVQGRLGGGKSNRERSRSSLEWRTTCSAMA